jgi:hypothetical protein
MVVKTSLVAFAQGRHNAPPGVLTLPASPPIAPAHCQTGATRSPAVLIAKLASFCPRLAKDLAVGNPELTSHEVESAAREIVSRVLFQRMADDRGIEGVGSLQEPAYVGDIRSPGLQLSDQLLRDLVRCVRDSDSECAGSFLPADLLGQVYEHMQEAPKARGLHYTPAYIVDDIVHQTVGRLLEGKSPWQAAHLRILDPACGSGRFLLGAYQYLLDWHRDWYIADGPERHPGELYGAESALLQNAGSQCYLLTPAERRRIALSNIFGLDLDPQAVGVARRSLLLKMWEDLPGKGPDRKEEHRPVEWPDLSENIKCGDALVGPDFFDRPARNNVELDQFERRRLNAFDWRGPGGFGEIMQSGGFDAVIGNPPYVNIRVLTTAFGKQVKEYFSRRYACARQGFDLYVLFIELAARVLRNGGYGGMIVPNKLGTLEYAKACRSLLLEQTTIHRLVDTSGFRAFPRAGVYPYVIAWQQSRPPANHRIQVVQALAPSDLIRYPPATLIPQSSLSAAGGFQLHGQLDVESRVPTMPLSSCCRLESGTTGFVAQKVAQELRERDSSASPSFDFIVSRNIDRYAISLGNVPFMKRRFSSPTLASDCEILTDRKRRLYASSKIVIAGLTRRIEAAWDEAGLALGVQVFSASDLSAPPYYLLGLLNSRLMSYLFRLRFQAKQLAGGYLAINLGQLAQLPIRTVDDKDRIAERQQAELGELAQEIHCLSKDTATANTDQAKRALERRIDALDGQIDHLTYALYGLTDSEIEQAEAVDFTGPHRS